MGKGGRSGGMGKGDEDMGRTSEEGKDVGRRREGCGKKKDGRRRNERRGRKGRSRRDEGYKGSWREEKLRCYSIEAMFLLASSKSSLKHRARVLLVSYRGTLRSALF